MALFFNKLILVHARTGKSDDLQRALLAEEAAELRRDKKYWPPLRRELENLRHTRKAAEMPGA